MIPVAKGCQHIGCSRPVAARNLCETHYKRLMRHGSTDAGHPPDRGQREKHPLYATWCNLMRYHKRNCDPAWHDLWSFAKDIGDKPPEGARIARIDRELPWGGKNVYWKVVFRSQEGRAKNSVKMRAYQQSLRDANPDYFRDKDLRRNYGVTLAWYEAILAKQGGACAICKKPEDKVLKGRLLRLAVDHCHATGKVRGLLCVNCNRGIGNLQHDRTILTAALAYLKNTV